MRNLFVYITLLLGVFMLGSCNVRDNRSKREADAVNALAGEWIGHPFGANITEYLDFREDGTARGWYVGENGKGEEFPFTYELEKGKVNVTVNNETSMEFTFDGSELVGKTGVIYTKITR